MISVILLAALVDWTAWAGVSLAFITLALTFIYRYSDKESKSVEKITADITAIQLSCAEMRVKVDTMWAYQFRRAVTEGANKGLVDVNSPARPIPALRALFDNGLRKSLTEFYSTLPEGTSDFEAAITLEHEFGDRLMKLIALPNKLHYGVVLVGALSVAKETNGKTPTVQLTPESPMLESLS
jgi:hypothetical protein